MNTEEKIIQVPIEDIIPNRFQPRLAFDEEGLKELSESIKQHGIIQPLVLRRLGDKYEIIAEKDVIKHPSWPVYERFQL